MSIWGVLGLLMARDYQKKWAEAKPRPKSLQQSMTDTLREEREVSLPRCYLSVKAV